MEPLHILVKAGLYLLMGISVLGAFGAVSLPNLFHAALSLILTLLGIAGIFIALHAEFLGLVQILLYVGAVMTLVIFAIMMTEKIQDPGMRSHNNLALRGALPCAIIFFMLLSGILKRVPWRIRPEALEARLSIADLGTALMTKYVFPFEVISVFLIAALIGAMIIAKKDKPHDPSA